MDSSFTVATMESESPAFLSALASIKLASLFLASCTADLSVAGVSVAAAPAGGASLVGASAAPEFSAGLAKAAVGSLTGVAAAWRASDLSGATAGTGLKPLLWAASGTLAPTSTAAPSKRVVAIRIVNLDLWLWRTKALRRIL